MYLLYLDESGDPNSWHQQTCYVIGGVAIHEGQVHKFSDMIDALQKKHFPGINIHIPFHATELRNGKGQFNRFSPKERNVMLLDVYNVISKAVFPDIIVFATAMDITSAKSPSQDRRIVFEDVCEKFNGFLVHQFKLNRPNKGMLIIDQNRENEYRELVKDFHMVGTKHGYIGNIIDIPYFARCHDTRMLQLADFIAHAIFQYYEKGDMTYLNPILPNIYGGVNSTKISAGFGHITKKKCKCKACL